MKSFKFGETVNGLPLIAHRFGNSGPKVLILGGVHGDEWEGVIAANGLLGSFLESFTFKLQLTILPVFNLDGFSRGQRKNARDVDLNRNLPTNDWTATVDTERYDPGPEPNSEPENKALVSWLSEHKPRFVLSLHSWKPLLNINGDCRPQAEVISRINGYEIMESIGYPTPGCLGTYCGLERDMPTLTYEVERGQEAKSILGMHVPAILEALKLTEDRY